MAKASEMTAEARLAHRLRVYPDDPAALSRRRAHDRAERSSTKRDNCLRGSLLFPGDRHF
jgi:hypothetical protein